MKMVTIHGPNNSWTHLLEDSVAESIIEAFRTGRLISYTYSTGSGWLTDETDYMFNPAIVVAITVRDE